MPTPAKSAKPDNLFGVCHAVADAFGIEPLYLRLAIMALMLANFEVALVVYGVLGLAVLAGSLATRGFRRRTTLA